MEEPVRTACRRAVDDLEQAEQTLKVQVRIQMMRLVAVTVAHKSRWLPAEKDGRQGARP